MEQNKNQTHISPPYVANQANKFDADSFPVKKNTTQESSLQTYSNQFLTNNFLIDKYFGYLNGFKIRNLSGEDFDLIYNKNLALTAFGLALVTDRYHLIRYQLYGAKTLRLFSFGLHFSIFYYIAHNSYDLYKHIIQYKTIHGNLS